MGATDPKTWTALPSPSHPDFDSDTELAMLRAAAEGLLASGEDLSVRLAASEPGYPCVEVSKRGKPFAELHIVLGDGRARYRYGVFQTDGDSPDAEAYVEDVTSVVDAVRQLIPR